VQHKTRHPTTIGASNTFCSAALQQLKNAQVELAGSSAVDIFRSEAYALRKGRSDNKQLQAEYVRSTKGEKS
jgi:hypothetical protein